MECSIEPEAELEVHRCKECGDTYCVHNMKSVGKDAKCWVCGSEKKEKANEVPVPPL